MVRGGWIWEGQLEDGMERMKMGCEEWRHGKGRLEMGWKGWYGNGRVGDGKGRMEMRREG